MLPIRCEICAVTANGDNSGRPRIETANGVEVDTQGLALRLVDSRDLAR
jgi:hypothetical protein